MRFLGNYQQNYKEDILNEVESMMYKLNDIF